MKKGREEKGGRKERKKEKREREKKYGMSYTYKFY
jgi:hypothetical protein